MSELRLYLFGMPRIEYKGETIIIKRRKSLALAAYLAMSGQVQSREFVASLLWSESDQSRAYAALRSALHSLTKPIPIDWIQADRTTITLNHEQVWVDVKVFSELLNKGSNHKHDTGTVCEECVGYFEQAITLYSADFLPGFYLSDADVFQEWQSTQQAWLRREYTDSLRRLAYYRDQLKDYQKAIELTQQWLALDPIDENAHRHLMRLYTTVGQKAKAIQQYHHCVQILETELASPPENETTQVFHTIQNQQDSTYQMSPTDFTGSIGVMPALPSIMIGREDAIDDIKKRLGIGGSEKRAFTLIQGYPGIGKSTLVASLAHDSDIAEQFPDGILWTSLGENPDILGELTTWANGLGLYEISRERKVEEVSTQLTAALRDKRVLLIIDDIWQAEHAFPFRIGGQHSAHVLTSRLNDVATALSPTASDLYHLSVLNDESALALLHALTPETTSAYPDESQQLIHDLEGLPLAIHVAGRLLQNEARLGWGIQDLLQEIRQGASLLEAKAPSDMLGLVSDSSVTVASLLKRSTDLLDDVTRQRFAYLGLFVPKPATFDLESMAIAWNIDDPKPTARILMNRGLLEPVARGRFQMHALLVLHARSLLPEESYQL